MSEETGATSEEKRTREGAEQAQALDRVTDHVGTCSIRNGHESLLACIALQMHGKVHLSSALRDVFLIKSLIMINWKVAAFTFIQWLCHHALTQEHSMSIPGYI